jgi:transcriptional regulator with XRE-family HTH domain
MDHGGEKLRRARERLKLTYRDVEEASQMIAAHCDSPEFLIPLSRLADIENRGRVPTIFRLYTLCAIYKLDLHDVMRWYGVPVEQLVSEALRVPLEETHLVEMNPHGTVTLPHPSEKEIDLNRTTFLSQVIRRWGKVPFSFLKGHEAQHRYGLIGLEDWSMFPILRPGSLVLINEGCRKIAASGWTSEFDRPIYFLEHRDGFLCGWCTLEADRLLVQPHPSSEQRASVFRYPEEIDVIGQVVGIAMLFEAKKHRGGRASGVASAEL